MLKRVGSSFTSRAGLVGSCADDVSTWLLLRQTHGPLQQTSREVASVNDEVELAGLEPDGMLRRIPLPVTYPRLGSYLLDVRVWDNAAEREVFVWFGAAMDLRLVSFDGTGWLSWSVSEGRCQQTPIKEPVHTDNLPPAPTEAQLPPHRRISKPLGDREDLQRRAGVLAVRESRGWRIIERRSEVRLDYPAGRISSS